MRAVLGLAAAAAVLLPAAPAAAWSCAQLDTSRAPVVLVGTVEAAWSEHARLAVDEVWAGPDLAPVVWIETGSDPTDGSTYLNVGEQHVMTADESFRTSFCEVRLVDEDVTRPADVREPVADGLTGTDAPRSVAETTAWGAGGLALVVALVLVRRRRGRAAAGRR